MMEHYLSSLIALYAAAIAAAIYTVRRFCKRWEDAEKLRARRAAEREREQFEIGQRIRCAMERERIMHEPVTPKRNPVRKAVGLFSDEAAQELIRNA